MCTRTFDQKLGSSLIYFLYLHTTIRPSYMVLFHLFFVQCTTIRSKIRVLFNLFFILVHDHSTKVRGHSYSLIYYFLNCPNISFAIFMVDIALIIFRALCFKQYCFYVSYANSYTLIHFVHYIHGRTALIFHTLCPWLYEVLI